MTPRIYDEDSHQLDFTAVVESVTPCDKGFDIVLDRTAFFPGGGGQEADRGTLGGYPVLGFTEQDQIVHHLLAAPLTEGSLVEGHVDGALRFSNMQQHSGEHVVSGLLHAAYGVDNVGFHMGSDEVTLDINGTVSMEALLEIEKKANEAVRRNLPVTVTYPEPCVLEALNYRSKKALEGAVRIVTIGDLDCCACCAPHVKLTGEIGLIKILSAQRYKGGTRISMLSGSRALEVVNRYQQACTAIGLTLSTGTDQIAAAVGRLKEELKAKNEKEALLERSLMEYRAQEAPLGSEIYYSFEDTDSLTARHFVNLLTARREGPVAIYIKKAPEAYQYILASGTQSVRDLAQRMHQALNGRGGGSDAMFQGTVKAPEEAIRAFWDDLK